MLHTTRTSLLAPRKTSGTPALLAKECIVARDQLLEEVDGEKPTLIPRSDFQLHIHFILLKHRDLHSPVDASIAGFGEAGVRVTTALLAKWHLDVESRIDIAGQN
jgi:hypothetical protein